MKRGRKAALQSLSDGDRDRFDVPGRVLPCGIETLVFLCQALGVGRPAKPKKSDSHANKTKSRVPALVDEIVSRMLTGAWQRGASVAPFAQECGLSESRVKDLSAEAWRRVCAQANDAEAARPTIAGYLLANIARADAEGNAVAVAKVADVYSKVIGARAPVQTQEVPLTEEQARARWKELTGKEWGT